MGPGFPPRLPADSRVHRFPAAAPYRGSLYRYGDRACARGYPADARPAKPRDGGDGLRSQEPLLWLRGDGRQGQGRVGARLCDRAFGRERHRVLLDPQDGRCAGRRACRGAGPQRHSRWPLPCRHGQRGPPPKPARLYRRRYPGDGCHQRLWHGHRQARCAPRHPLRLPRLHRSLLPGSGPCRTRRPATRPAATCCGTATIFACAAF